MLAVRGVSEITLFVYNHNIPDEAIHAEEVEIKLKDIVPAGLALIRRVDAHNANPKQKWIALGSPEYPGKDKLAEIEKASHLVPQPMSIETVPVGCAMRFVMPAHGVAAITIPL